MSAHKILLVDDSKSARYALRLLLQKHNFNVDTADSAENALDKVKEELPDAIFMDHLMPGMNGFEALEVLKGNPDTAQIPVVMCTSNDDEPYQIEAREKGALGILPKPATPEKLFAMIESIDAAMTRQGATAPAAVTTPAMDKAAISTLISDQLKKFMEREIRPLLGESIDRRLEEMQSTISESLLGRSAAQIEEWTEAEMGRARQELSAQRAAIATGHEKLSARFTAGFKELKDALVQMETSHAHPDIQSISTKVLPDLVQKQLEQVQQQLYGQLDRRLEEMSGQLVKSLPGNNQLIRKISKVAETVAEHKAANVAVMRAQEIVDSSAEEKSSEMSGLLLDSTDSTDRRIYMVGAVAAGIGVMSSVLMFVLAG